MATNGLERNSDLMTLFRCDYWYKWFIKQSIKNIFLWRNRVVLKFLLIKLFYFMNKTIFWKGVVARLKRDLL